MAQLTVGQRIALSNLLAVKYPDRVNLDGGTCCGKDHNRLPDTAGRNVELLFVVKNVPLCEDCYEDAYKAAQAAVKMLNVGIMDVLKASRAA